MLDIYRSSSVQENPAGAAMDKRADISTDKRTHTVTQTRQTHSHTDISMDKRTHTRTYPRTDALTLAHL